MGTHWKCLIKALLISTNNICFCEEIRKTLYGGPSLTPAMVKINMF